MYAIVNDTFRRNYQSQQPLMSIIEFYFLCGSIGNIQKIKLNSVVFRMVGFSSQQRVYIYGRHICHYYLSKNVSSSVSQLT